MTDRPERVPEVVFDVTYQSDKLLPGEQVAVWFNSQAVVPLPSSPCRVTYTPTSVGKVVFNVAIVNEGARTAIPLPALSQTLTVEKVG